MANLPCVFLACIALLVVMDMAETAKVAKLKDGSGGGSTKKPTTTKPPVCRDSKLSTLPKSCCNVTAQSLFTAAQLKACSKETELHKWANSFMLNTLQEPKEKAVNQTISFTNKDTKEKMCSFAAFATCLLSTNSMLMANGSINSTAVGEFFSNSQNESAYQNAMIQFAANADQAISKMNINGGIVQCSSGKKGELPKNVSLSAPFLIQAAQAMLIESCPGPLNATTANKCDILRRDYAFCSQIMVNQINGAKAPMLIGSTNAQFKESFGLNN